MSKLTAEMIEQAAAQIAAGRSIRSLAPEFGVNESSLRRALPRTAVSAAGYRGLSVDPGAVEVPIFFRDYSHLEKLHLYPLGDVHKGARTHASRHWAEWLDYLIDTPHAAMLGTGDFFNAAIIGSKSDVYEERMSVRDARRELYEELAPLAESGRLDGLAEGNHEGRITRAVGDSPAEILAEMLRVPYIDALAVFVYTVGGQEYEVVLRHGEGNGQSLVSLEKGSKIAPLADVHITGHTHRQAVLPSDFFVREGGEMVRRHRYYVSSGSFLGLERYAAQRGYSPTRLGAPRIRLDGRSHDVHVSV